MHEDIGPRRGQFQRDSVADAAGGAGHDGAQPGQIATFLSVLANRPTTPPWYD